MDIDEGMGAMPLALGICALLLIACGCFRVITAQTRTSRVVARWLEGARPFKVDSSTQTVTFCSRREAPPLTLVGVRKPRVLVSESTVALLSDDELHIALRHELAHMQSRDNLKKLIFRFCPFPGMAKLESAWSQAAELAADDAAVSNLDDAVDLAAALVKLSRLIPVEAAPVCTVGFVTGSISARVARLLAWDEAGKAQPTRVRPGMSFHRCLRFCCASSPLTAPLWRSRTQLQSGWSASFSTPSSAAHYSALPFLIPTISGSSWRVPLLSIRRVPERANWLILVRYPPDICLFFLARHARPESERRRSVGKSRTRARRECRVLGSWCSPADLPLPARRRPMSGESSALRDCCPVPIGSR